MIRSNKASLEKTGGISLPVVSYSPGGQSILLPPLVVMTMASRVYLSRQEGPEIVMRYH